MRQEEAFEFYLGTRNNGALPLDPACLERLNDLGLNFRIQGLGINKK
jgi:hypothetical protein